MNFFPGAAKPRAAAEEGERRLSALRLSLPSAACQPAQAALPVTLAFLTLYGIDAKILFASAREAGRQAVHPETVLLARGSITEAFFYECLADYLGSAFTVSNVQVAVNARRPCYLHRDRVPIKANSDTHLLFAPRGETLRQLLIEAARGEPLAAGVVITTPSHLSELLRNCTAQRLAWDASFGLAALDPYLSAEFGATPAQCGCALVAAAATSFAIGLSPASSIASITLVMTFFFLASIWLRLFAGAASRPAGRMVPQTRTLDRGLPVYSIVVALHREARVVRQLVAALNALDYPRGKLDIKLVIEQDDVATRTALDSLHLPAIYEIIVAPAGWPKTKPRALNIALPLARGEFLVVFDAEDEPEPRQLRDAVERFRHGPAELACLQARLAIDNIEDSWLTRLFAIEYAVLFDVLNPGLAELGLPMPLGGSSNHFKTAVLREVCGWDAWNVTEDADLGLRLARFGFRIGMLPSSTQEEAPARLTAWLTQRRRWSKGWMQTFITLTRDPRRLAAELGAKDNLAVVLLMTGLVIAPPLWPAFALLFFHDVWGGLPHPATALQLVSAVTWTSTFFFGFISILWLSLLGMRRRKILGLWPFLLLLIPYYILTSVAAWMALYDLILRPFHWHKTEHGLAKTSRQETLAARKALEGESRTHEWADQRIPLALEKNFV
ncbi:MAG TPA: glycosyltransferase [Methylocella sp.]|nr:glycosyltransferase [Methylocella sp.]